MPHTIKIDGIGHEPHRNFEVRAITDDGREVYRAWIIDRDEGENVVRAAASELWREV